MTIFVGELPREQPYARWPVADQTLALHEAAHAAAAIEAGMRVEHVNLSECVAIRGDATPRGLAVYALAGAAMAGRLGRVMSGVDEAVFKKALDEGVAIWRGPYAALSEFDVRAIVRSEFEACAKAFVDKNNADIRRLAFALLEHRHLNGDQCVHILGNRWRPKPMRPVVRLGD